MGGPTSSYATAGIGLRVTGVLKPPHHDKVEAPLRRSSNLGSRNWKSNNLKLARDNARLKKEVKKWVQHHTEQTVRYTALEMSWRHRGVSTVVR